MRVFKLMRLLKELNSIFKRSSGYQASSSLFPFLSWNCFLICKKIKKKTPGQTWAPLRYVLPMSTSSSTSLLYHILDSYITSHVSTISPTSMHYVLDPNITWHISASSPTYIPTSYITSQHHLTYLYIVSYFIFYTHLPSFLTISKHN